MESEFYVFQVPWSYGLRDTVRCAVFSVAVLLSPCIGFAADAPPAVMPGYVLAPVQPYGVAPLVRDGFLADTTPTAPVIPKPFDGLGFGAGVAASFGQPRVNSASVVNGVVRVTDSSNVMAGIVFESHYFFLPPSPFLGVKAGSWGIGPFVAVDASTANGSTVVAGFSMGLMVGFRRSGLTTVPVPVTLQGSSQPALLAVATPTTDNNSWNFGVGFRVDPKATVFGDGVVANQPPPLGEASIPVRLKTAPRYGVMLMTSFSFN